MKNKTILLLIIVLYLVLPVYSSQDEAAKEKYAYKYQFSLEKSVFAQYSGIAIYKENIFVTDSKLNRILVFNVQGDLLRQVPSNNPFNISAYRFGNAYVGDREKGCVTVYKILIDDNNQVSFKTKKVIKEVAVNGSNNRFSPADSVSDGFGNLYVVDQENNQILKFDNNYEFIRAWGQEGSEKGQFNKPNGIAVDSEENVWVADFGSNRMQIFTRSGVFIKDFYCNAPIDIAFDLSTNGDKVLVASQDNRIYVFQTDGQHFAKQPKYFGEPGSGNGQFSNITGIAVSKGGNIYVLDAGNQRVQIFETVFN